MHIPSCTGQLGPCTPQDSQGPSYHQLQQLHCPAVASAAPAGRWSLDLLFCSLAVRPVTLPTDRGQKLVLQACLIVGGWECGV